ncbi:hypothetical protein J6590_034858 [Homalodisca vitripennis]|nr:hypothetical protein J6590_034858 [Homalodisca vitripennis]
MVHSIESCSKKDISWIKSRAKKPSLTLNLGTNGFKGDFRTTTNGRAGLQRRDCSAVTHPSSSHARRCLIWLSRDNRCTCYTAPLAVIVQKETEVHGMSYGCVVTGQESADSSILDNHEVLINVSDMRETQVIPVVGDNEGTITGSDASMEIVELDEESSPEGEEPLSQEAEVQDSPLNLSTGQ